MPTRLLIDGYNVLNRGAVGASFDATDLEGARGYLLERLFEYKREKRIQVAIVFDATQGVSLSRKKASYKGIEVIYSKQGETADQVIIEVIQKRQSGLVVVTSDRAIIDEAKRHGIAFITPDRLAASMNGGEDDDRETRTDKKGNPHKAPKNLRKARRAIRKV
jgi:predicted RNA-binding protein with PIN domain